MYLILNQDIAGGQKFSKLIEEQKKKIFLQTWRKPQG